MKKIKKYSLVLTFLAVLGFGFLFPIKAASLIGTGSRSFSTPAGILNAYTRVTHYTTGNTRWSHYEYATSSTPYRSASASANATEMTNNYIKLYITATMTNNNYTYGSGSGYIKMTQNGSSVYQTE